MRQRSRTGDAGQVLLLNLGEAEMDYFPVNCSSEMWRLLGCFSASPWREEQNIQVLWMLGRAGKMGSAEVRTPREERSLLDMASVVHTQPPFP